METLGADPRLTELRERLARARDFAVDFAAAWEPAVAAALADTTAFERAIYERALEGTRTSWEAAYLRQPATGVDRAVSELEAFAADGELDSLSQSTLSASR